MSQELKKSPYIARILGTWGSFSIVALLMSVPLGPVPSLGNFLSPATGYLQNGRFSTNKSETLTLSFKSLRDQVKITIDTRGVPHIVASNDSDLAFGQGFATARDRLWQMELQTAATAGRVSEILGKKALNYDIRQRKLGLLNAAVEEVAFLQERDKEQYELLVAYSAGVNAYIQSLDPSNYPIEYKLLGTSPEPWTPVKCALFHKQMAWTLTQSYDDFKFTNTLQKYSESEIENLFPTYHEGSSPILSNEISQISSAPIAQLRRQAPPLQFDGVLNLKDLPAHSPSSTKGTNGSNNWVMDGLKTQHGYPVLANDPHLELKLPAIWYEVQLTAPGVNVYGVSLPGLPHVIIGFNEDVSWGITNSGNDVIDWYAITFDKSTLSQKYKVDDEWKQPVIKQEVIKVKNGTDHVIDVLYTDYGPVAQEYNLEKKNGNTEVISFAMKWTGSKPSNEFRAFYSLNRANSVRDMKNALRTYSVPGQNFMLADKTGSIGYVQAGAFPIRSRHFGRFVLDGSKSENDWSGYVPFSHLPQSWSPDRGFIASANQQPTLTPSPGFSGGEWEYSSYLRGSRINEQLKEFTDNGPTKAEALIQLQNDVVSLRAKRLLPTLTEWARAERNSPEIAQALDLLEGWNFELKKDSTEAAVWSVWWDVFYQSLWEPSFPSPHFIPPSEDRTMELILGNTIGGWPQSPQVLAFSKVPNLAIQSLKNAIKTLNIFKKKEEIKELFPTWGQFRGTSIPHLANLSGFGIDRLYTAGNGDTVNATTYTHGPSWRMVVTWKDAIPKAWGIYPGGQSGHVGSEYYSNMVGKWTDGLLDELLFVPQGRLKSEFVSENLLLEVQK